MEGPFGTTGLSLTATTLKDLCCFQTFQLSNSNAEKPKPKQRLLFVIYKSQSVNKSQWSIFSLSFFLAYFLGQENSTAQLSSAAC